MLASPAVLSSPPPSRVHATGAPSAIPLRTSSAATDTSAAGRNKARMRWADAPKVFTPLPTQTTFRTAAASTQSSVKRGDVLTLAATLEKFDKLARRLERYDKRDLADFGSALRVRHQKSRLTTAELMRLPNQLQRLRKDVAVAAADLRTRPAHSSEPPGAEHLQCYDEATALLSRLQHLDPQRAPRCCETDVADTDLRAPAMPAWKPSSMDGQAFIASLRAKALPIPVKQDYSACKAIVNQIDQELALLDRAEGVLSAQLQSLLEEDDLAGALAATSKELNLHLCSSMLGKARTAQAKQATDRLAVLKKKLDALGPEDVSTAARKLRLKGRDENIRCRNLLGTLPRLARPNPLLCYPADHLSGSPTHAAAILLAAEANVNQPAPDLPESAHAVTPLREQRVRLINPFFRNPLYFDDGYDSEKSPVDRSPVSAPIATVFEAVDEYQTDENEDLKPGAVAAILANAAYAAAEAALPAWARDKRIVDQPLTAQWTPPRHDISIPASWTAPQTVIGKLARGRNIIWKTAT